MIWIDCETYSTIGGPGDVGTYRYAENCEVMVVAWATDDGPVHVWDTTVVAHPWELILRAHLNGAETLTAHNAMFDRNVLKRIGFDAPLHKWRCTMVQALSHALPGSLSELGSRLGLPEDRSKMADG